MISNNIINLESLELLPHNTGENYRSESAPLASKVGAKKLGFHVEILATKQFSCPYHFHHSEEELFLVLEGNAMLRQVNQYREIKKGDLIFFSNGPEGAHQLYNHTNHPLKYFALSTMDEYEVCEYPDSKKMYINRIKKTFHATSNVDYLKNEESPQNFWPPELI